jgi:hypothetical protein
MTVALESLPNAKENEFNYDYLLHQDLNNLIHHLAEERGSVLCATTMGYKDTNGKIICCVTDEL